jgi:hypothetical protein
VRRAAALRGLSALIATATTAVLLLVIVHDPGSNGWMVAWLGYLVVGALLIWRRPDNRIGWWLLAVGVSFVAGGLYYGAAYVFTASTPVLVTVLGQPLQALGWLALATLVTLFPTGRVTTGPQRVLLRFIATVGVVVSIALMIDVNAAQQGRHNPLNIPALEPFTSFVVNRGFAIVPLLLLASLVSLALRWRRSVGVERLQFRWLAWALGVCLLGVLVVWLGQFSGLSLFLGLAAFNAIPVAVGVAVTRYQLFNIDRIISRTASYAIVTGLLLATYVVVAASFSAVMGSVSTLAVTAATLTAAAVARPVLRRVQDVVDRRFNRSRYDALRTVDAFGRRLRNQIDPHHVTDDLVTVVRSTLQPGHIAVWVRHPN